MKKFKGIQKILIAVLIIFGLVTLIGASEVYGVTLKATDKRPYSDDDTNGTVGDDDYQVQRAANQTVFKIYEKGTETGAISYPDAIYCLRGGLGFGSGSYVTGNELEYTVVGDMRNDKATILGRFQSVTGQTLSDANYNSIVWIVDNMYLPRHVNTEDNTKTDAERIEMKEKLLLEAFKLRHKTENPTQTASWIESAAKADVAATTLTDDDIEVVQQMALWYFSNYDENGAPNSVSLPTDATLSNLLLIKGINNQTVELTTERKEDINVLYEYLITEAKNSDSIPLTPPVVEFGDTKPGIRNAEIMGLPYFLVGPFEIESTGSEDYDFKATIKYKDNQGITKTIEFDKSLDDAYITNETGTDPNTNKEIIDMIGEGEFYIALNEVYDDVEEVSIEIEYSYWETKRADFMDAGNGNQPVVIVEKVKKYGNDTITTETIEGSFDLVLHKVDEEGNPIITDDAKFTIRRIPSNTGADTYYTTNDNKETGEVTGIIRIEDIEITEENEEFIYEIEETKAPTGYEGVIGKFHIRVLTEKVGEEYKVTSATLVMQEGNNWVPATVEGVSIGVTIDDNSISIYVENKEKVEFDLSLRKFITQINDKELTGVDSREPQIDLSKLRTNSESTATYTHPKNPISVKKGDIVTYTLRMYNESDVDGYASEITDYLPEGLGFINDYKTNYDNEWGILDSGELEIVNLVGEDGFYESVEKVQNLKVEDFNGITSLDEVTIVAGKASITTSMLNWDDSAPEATVIKAYDREKASEDIEDTDLWQKTNESGQTDGLYYREVQVTCIVLAENSYQGILRNIAEISKAQDDEGNDMNNEGDDRDSTPNNVDTDNYNPPENNSSYQEDDDDYEPLKLERFDLSLKKFITEVESAGKTIKEDREPKPKMPEEEFDHDLEYVFGPGINKEATPVQVANGDIVTYKIRVYNEGTIDGYVEELKDDIPEGLEFLPEHQINKDYEWKMYYKNGDGELVETDDAKEVTEIRTEYLSSANETETRVNVIRPFDQKEEISHVDPLNPDYKDVEIAFKVIEPEDKEHAGRIIINTAEITKDNDDDIDSTPDNDKDGEDDIDKEYIYVKYFDLSLIKWVSKAIVTVDGKTTTTKYKMPGDDPGSDYLVKVDLGRRDVKKVTVKFEYTIKIINEGEIEGYATEITDDIPEGLEFIAKDNPSWKKDGNKVTTRALEKTLLKPGESAEVTIIFKWKNSGSNVGTIKNIAEITDDYNKHGSRDIDSIPKNNIPEEDDQDYALVIVTIKTGGEVVAMPVIGMILTVLLGGTFLIKKYVVL